MLTVHKVVMPCAPGRYRTRLHADAELLCAKIQRGFIAVWARVSTVEPDVPYTFNVVGTGSGPALGRYVGTVIEEQTGLVWHVFSDPNG